MPQGESLNSRFRDELSFSVPCPNSVSLKKLKKKMASELREWGSIVRNCLDRMAYLSSGDTRESAFSMRSSAFEMWCAWQADIKAYTLARQRILDCADNLEEHKILEDIFPTEGPGKRAATAMRQADQIVFNEMLSASAAQWRSTLDALLDSGKRSL